MIKILRDTDSLLENKEIWNRIFDKDTEATPFQQFEFVYSSLFLDPSAVDSIYVIMVKDDASNQWIAIFPFVLDKKGILRYVNARHTDFCTPIVVPQYNHYNLYKELAECISENDKIKGLVLENVTSYNVLTGVLKPYFRYTITHDINHYPKLPIYQAKDDKDSVSAFRFLRSQQIKKLRKIQKQIESNCSFEIRRATDGDEYPQKEVETLVAQMLKAAIRDKSYFSDEMLAFWRDLYEKGVLVAALLYENDEIRTCNFMYYDEKRNEYIKWIMLYKENSWNMKINIMIADYLYNNGGGTINFARGIYDYKLTNFHPDVKPLFCVRIAKTRWGHFRNIMSTALHYAKPIVKSWLGR